MDNPFISSINSLLPEPHASLLNGIIFGYKSQLSKGLYQALIETGTLHIIALSGMNITILVSLTAKTTLFLGRRFSSLLTIGLIVLFVMLVGMSPTVVRAAIMGSMSLLAIYFCRQYQALLALVLTSLIMLLFDLNLIKSLSFQLSFLATLGLILANRKGERQLKNSSWEKLIYSIKENFRLALVAQLFTLPVILYYFQRISLISPIANLLIEWAVQPIMVLGLTASVLGYFWLPAGFIPAWLAWVPLTYLITVIRLLARIPGASFEF